MRVFITGITGFIGKALAARFEQTGWSVVGSSTGRTASNAHTIALGDPFDGSIFMGADVVIHCAYAFGKGAFEVNTAGTRAVAEAARQAGVQHQLFVSSFSADPRATSDYGRSKLQLEDYFTRLGYCSVRPGLVIGNGGLYAKLSAVVAKFPVVPVPAATTPVIGAAELAESIHLLCEQRARGVVRLFHQERASLQEIVRQIARAQKRRRLIIPIPLGPVSTMARVGSRLLPQLHSTAESLAGLAASQSFVAESDLARLVTPRSLESIVREAEIHFDPEKPC
jgi:nucleoside-diphosphate-sugar epimerase